MPPSPPNNRKRGRKAREGKSPSKTTRPAQPRGSKQRRISDANVGFRVSKAASKSTPKDVAASAVSLLVQIGSVTEDYEHTEDVRRSLRSADAASKYSAELSSYSNRTTLTQAFANLANPSPEPAHTLVQSNALHGWQDQDQSQEDVADEFFDDVFDSMDLDEAAFQIDPDASFPNATNVADSSATTCANDAALLSTPILSDDFSSSVHCDEILIDLDDDLAGETLPVCTSPDSGYVQGPSTKFISPVTRETEAPIWDQARITSHATDRKPIVRSVFPDPVRDRSPVIGLSSKLMLRSCFRVGEAISQAGKAMKQGQNLLFELYARVLSSERDAAKQHFVFSDVFHHRPPYLKGEYDAAIWKNVELFNYDSGRFLPDAKMCRCVGKIKRNDKDKTWVMIVHNIWEATWEDIDWVEGIVNS